MYILGIVSSQLVISILWKIDLRYLWNCYTLSIWIRLRRTRGILEETEYCRLLSSLFKSEGLNTLLSPKSLSFLHSGWCPLLLQQFISPRLDTAQKPHDSKTYSKVAKFSWWSLSYSPRNQKDLDLSPEICLKNGVHIGWTYNNFVVKYFGDVPARSRLRSMRRFWLPEALTPLFFQLEPSNFARGIFVPST